MPARRWRRFLNKHEPMINTLLEQAVSEYTPKTANALESKNSLFKPFSRITKEFTMNTTEKTRFDKL